MNPLVLNRENIFSDIKFLICIHIIPSVKFAIFETKFAKVSSLVIFSHENILSSGIINVTNVKRIKISKAKPDIRIFGTLFIYDTQQCLGIKAK